MPFTITPTLSNHDSKIRIDVESSARIILCDIDYILNTINHISDARHQTFLLESAITKTASVFQLAIRACDYLEKKDFKKEIINRTKKGNGSSLGLIGFLRENSFHNGHRVLNSERFYPFARIKGHGFVGIYIHRGASLDISGYHKFHSLDFEYAITPEGIYQIENVGMNNETWIQIKTPFDVVSTDIKNVIDAINEATTDLKEIWKELRDIRIKGDGTHEYSYLNEGGALELLEKGKEKITAYKVDTSIRLKGILTITPPDGIKVEAVSLTYFIENKLTQKNAQTDASIGS
jgi:hypothetical protein